MSKITFNLDPAFLDEMASCCEAERVRINEAMGKHRAYYGGFIG